MKMFRNAAMEQQTAPDDLDQLLKVSDRRSWLFVVASGMLLCASSAWSVFGEVTRRAQAPAIMLSENGAIYRAKSYSGGLVKTVVIGVNDNVEEGDLVAIIDVPELEQQTQKAKLELEYLLAQRDHLANENEQELTSRSQTTRLHQQQIDSQVSALEEQISYLQTALAGRESELAEGFATNAQVESLRGQLADARTKLIGAKANLSKLDQDFQSALFADQDRLKDLDIQIDKSRILLAQAKSASDRGQKAVAPVTGRVVENSIRTGDFVRAGDGIALIETGDNTYEAVIFLTPDEGKRVHAGMSIQLSPAGFKREEYGYIPGKIKYVGEFPASHEAILSLVGEESINQFLTHNGPTYIAKASLEVGADGHSLKWSGRSPPERLNTGALGTADVVIEKVKPITLVIPTLKNWLKI